MRHRNAEALICAAPHNFAQKNYIVPVFLYGNAVVFYAVQPALQLAELMVMGGKQCFGADIFLFGNIFGHSPGDGKPVEGAGTAAYFV